jgi:hypothetical protein
MASARPRVGSPSVAEAMLTASNPRVEPVDRARAVQVAFSGKIDDAQWATLHELLYDARLASAVIITCSNREALKLAAECRELDEPAQLRLIERATTWGKRARHEAFDTLANSLTLTSTGAQALLAAAEAGDDTNYVRDLKVHLDRFVGYGLPGTPSAQGKARFSTDHDELVALASHPRRVVRDLLAYNPALPLEAAQIVAGDINPDAFEAIYRRFEGDRDARIALIAREPRKLIDATYAELGEDAVERLLAEAAPFGAQIRLVARILRHRTLTDAEVAALPWPALRHLAEDDDGPKELAATLIEQETARAFAGRDPVVAEIFHGLSDGFEGSFGELLETARLLARD